jgi:MFS family permease
MPGLAATPDPIADQGEAAAGRWAVFASFRFRHYRTLWVAMALGFMGMMMQGVARGWLAYDLTGAHTAVGVVMLAWGIPQLGFSLLGGAIADRVDKRLVMIWTQVVIAATAFLTGAVITGGMISIAFLFVMGLVQGTVFAFNLPARQAALPELVPRSHLMNAMALSNTAMNASAIVAPAIAGTLMARFDVALVFHVQGVLNLLVAYLVSRLPVGGAKASEDRRTVFGDIKVGLSFIRSSRVLLLLILMAFVPSLLGMPYNVLLPGFATEDMGLSESGYGILLMAPAIGALHGSIAIAGLGKHVHVPFVQACAGLAFGLSLIGLALLSSLAGIGGALVALFGIGLASASYMTLNGTSLMNATPPELYGRVMSVYMLTFSLFPLASWPMGMVADAITARATFWVLGGGNTAFIVLVVAANAAYFLRPRASGERATTPKRATVP